MTDFLLILILIAIFVFGYFVVRCWDRFLQTLNRVRPNRRKKSKTTHIDKKR